MSNPEPTIRINVDVTNPGQFFACCGLLELADRLSPGAEGWFDQRHFYISCSDVLSDIIESLKSSRLSILTQEGEPSIHPIRLEDPFGLTLNWWIRNDWAKFRQKPKKDRVGLMRTQWKFWAGNQSSHQIFRVLLESLAIPEPDQDYDCFAASEMLSSRFGLDPAPAWTALNVGFSINEHSITVRASALVEALAAVGLQRCRPKVNKGFADYRVWNHPQNPAVLAAVVSGEMAGLASQAFRTRIITRGSYAAITHSYPLKGVVYERQAKSGQRQRIASRKT